MNGSARWIPRLTIGVVVLATLVSIGLSVRLSPSVPDAADAPFAGRYRYYGMAVAPNDAGRIWLVGTYGQVRATEDGGRHWQVLPSALERHLQDVVALDASTLVAVGNGNTVVRSEDAGHSWVTVPVPMSSVENKLLRIRRAPSGELWAVGVMGAVLASRDEGRSFVRVAPPEDVAWNDVGFSGSGVWLVGEFGRIQYSPDGTHWQPLDSPVADSLMAIDFRGDQGVIAGLNGTALLSEDGGQSWQQVLLQAAPALYAAAVLGPRAVLLGGAHGSLLALGPGAQALTLKAGQLAPADVVLEMEARGRQLLALTQTHLLSTAWPEAPTVAAHSRPDASAALIAKRRSAGATPAPTSGNRL